MKIKQTTERRISAALRIGLVALLLDLCGGQSLGVPLLSPVSPYSGRLAWRDVFLRAGWGRLSRGEAPVQDMPGSRERGQ